MICEVLLSIIQKKLLYEEAINKEALFCYYIKIYIYIYIYIHTQTVKEGAAACYGSLNNIKNLIKKKGYSMMTSTIRQTYEMVACSYR